MSLFWGYYEWNNKLCLEWVNDVHMIVGRRNIDEFYDGHLAVTFVWFCLQLFLYVGLYKNADVDDLHEAKIL